MTKTVLALLCLVFCVAVVAAQDAPKIHVKEDADGLAAELKIANAAFDAAKAANTAAVKAAAAPGLSEEAKATLNKAAEAAGVVLASARTGRDDLRQALDRAKKGPTRAELAARLEFDRLANLAKTIWLELTAENESEPEERIGEYALAIRNADEDLLAIRARDDATQSFDISSSKVYERLSELEKLDYEIRYAEQSFQNKIDEYDHLVNGVFAAHVDFEQRAYLGLQTVDDALGRLKEFENSPALGLFVPVKPRAVRKELATLKREILRSVQILQGRAPGASREGSLRVRHGGKLKMIQSEIDIREDYRERLEQDVERLKDLEAGKKPATEEEEAEPPTAELERYKRVELEVQVIEARILELNAELLKLARDEELVGAQLVGKTKTEGSVEGEIAAKAAEITRVGSAPGRKPYIRLVVLGEEKLAQQERLVSAKRDTRQVETELDIVNRRLTNRRAELTRLEGEELPAKEKLYWSEFGNMAFWRAIKVGVVFLVAWILLWLIKVFSGPAIDRFVSRAGDKDEFSADEQQRARTLMTVFMTTARVVVYLTALMFVVSQLDVDYGPLLVASGGLALAVGFGAQTLVKDFFSGFFILLEGQYSIGDVVEINGKSGTVESLNLRTTVLRSLDGNVHIIPNGEFKQVSNKTKGWSRAVVNISVGYEENTDDVAAVMQAVVTELCDDEVFGGRVVEGYIAGVQEFGDSCVVMRAVIKTRAGEQWGVGREYRRRIKLLFDELGIEIPWPQTVVSYKAGVGKEDKQETERVASKKRAAITKFLASSRVRDEEEISPEEADRKAALAKHSAELEKDDDDEAERRKAEKLSKDVPDDDAD